MHVVSRVLATMGASMGTFFASLPTTTTISRNQNAWILGIVLTVIPSVMWLSSRRSNNKTKKRRVSFTSTGMAIGAFPPKANVPEPIINAAIFFEKDPPPSSQDVAEMVVKPMLEYERLSSILDASGGTIRPSEQNTIQPSDMVRSVTVSGNDDVTVQEIFRRFNESLTIGRNDLPWWEFLLIHNKGDGNSACVLRIHHALGDGLSLVEVFNHIITYQDGTSPLDNSSSIMEKAMKKRKQQHNKKWSFWTLMRETFHVITLGTTPYDDDTAFFSNKPRSNMVHSGHRSCVMFPCISLDFIKQLKNVLGVTVNDILMTCVSQAIHDYCENQHCSVLESKHTSLQCRALLPVSLPRNKPEEMQDKTQTLRNTWCMVSADMGVGYSNIMDRLACIHSKTQEIKSSPRAYLQLLIQNTIPPLLPVSVVQKTVYDVFSRHSLVFSNVPGPDRPVIFAGKVMDSIQMFLSNLIPQVGLISYNNVVYGNMVLDTDEIPNSASLARYYASAFVELAKQANVNVVPTNVVVAATGTK